MPAQPHPLSLSATGWGAESVPRKKPVSPEVAARRSAVRISREELRSRVRDLLADAKLAGYGREQVRKLMVAELERRMG